MYNKYYIKLYNFFTISFIFVFIYLVLFICICIKYNNYRAKIQEIA